MSASECAGVVAETVGVVVYTPSFGGEVAWWASETESVWVLCEAVDVAEVADRVDKLVSVGALAALAHLGVGAAAVEVEVALSGWAVVALEADWAGGLVGAVGLAVGGEGQAGADYLDEAGGTGLAEAVVVVGEAVGGGENAAWGGEGGERGAGGAEAGGEVHGEAVGR